MSYDLTNQKGGHWKCANAIWPMMLSEAHKAGWEPMGTVMYKHSGLHPDMVTFQPDEDGPTFVFSETEGDSALGFEQATKSGEVDPDWDGDYTGNCGQVITEPDASNMAAALKRSLDAGGWANDWLPYVRKLITVLEGGEARIT